MSDNFDLGDIPAWIALAVSIGLAIYQHKQNTKSHRDRVALEAKSAKDLKDLQKKLRLEQMIKDLDDLSALSLDYWTKPGDVGDTSALMIKVKAQDLGYRCIEYSRFLWDSAASDFSSIRRKITGGLFEVKTRPAIATTDPIIRDSTVLMGEFKLNLRRTCDSLDSLI